jgi:cytidylate kinase
MSVDATGGRGESVPRRPVVTVAALYGAGGSVIGPRVAERLGVEFLDRAIPASVAERMGVPEEVVIDYEEQPRSGIGRLIANLARAPASIPSGLEPVEFLELEERQMRVEIEEFLARASMHGGVVLGRGGAVVLGSAPGALHEYLRAPREARVEQAMKIEGIDRKTAERRLEANDRARREYVRSAYGVDGDDPSLYHLMLDTSVFDLNACVDFIVRASRLRMQQAQS